MSSMALAQDSDKFSTQASITSMVLSLAVVVGLIVVLATLFKKFNLHPSSNKDIKVVTAVPVGTRERLLVVEVNGEQHLLGVTQQSINHLFKLEQPISPESPMAVAEGFKDKLQQVLKNNK